MAVFSPSGALHIGSLHRSALHSKLGAGVPIRFVQHSHLNSSWLHSSKVSFLSGCWNHGLVRDGCANSKCPAAFRRGFYVSAEKSVLQTEVKPGSVIRRIQEQLLSREKSVVEVVQEYLSRLHESEPSLNSFLHVAEKSALEEASSLDKLLSEKRDNSLGPLFGIPFAAKDNLCTRGVPSTAGSLILQDYIPPYDATSINRLKSAGAILIGKTNLDEFGMGSTTENSGYKVTSNPWDLNRVPGGSSGGSAASVSSRTSAVALGSDTGGSIRQPASFCGVFGLKPTYGRVSRFGLMSYASSLDCVGMLSASALDSALVLEQLAGFDSFDSTSSKREVKYYSSRLTKVENFEASPLKGVKFGVIKETMAEGVNEEILSSVKAAIAHLESLGASVEEISLPHFSLGLNSYYILAPSEASSNLARYDGVRFGPRSDDVDLSAMYKNSRGDRFGKEVKRRILMGTYALSSGYYDAFYKRAQQVRTLIQRDFESALKNLDALISPTAPTTAYLKGEKTKDPLSMYLGDLMTVNVNLSGLPAVSVPCGLGSGGQNGLPIGFQLIGHAFGEDDILYYAHVFEHTNSLWTSSSS